MQQNKMYYKDDKELKSLNLIDFYPNQIVLNKNTQLGKKSISSNQNNASF